MIHIQYSTCWWFDPIEPPGVDVPVRLSGPPKAALCPPGVFRSVGSWRTSRRCEPSSPPCSATPSTAWRGPGRKCHGSVPRRGAFTCSSKLLDLWPLTSFCRESFRTFRELSEIFSDDNNYSLSRELLVKVRRHHLTDHIKHAAAQNLRIYYAVKTDNCDLLWPLKRLFFQRSFNIILYIFDLIIILSRC